MASVNQVCKNFYDNELPQLYTGSPTSAYITFCYAIIFIANTINALFLAIFLYNKNGYIRLKMMSTMLKFMSAFCFITFNTFFAVREIIGRQHFSCRVAVFLYHFCMFLLAGPLVSNLYLYIYKLRIQREKNAKYLKLMKQKHGANGARAHAQKPSIDIRGTSHDQVEDSNKVGFFQFCIDVINILKFTKGGKIVGKKSSKESEAEAENEGDNQSVTDHSLSDVTDLDASLFQYSNNTKSNIRTWKEMAIESILMPVGLVTLFGFPILLLIIYRFASDPLLINGCDGCEISMLDQIARFVYSVVYLSATVAALYAIRNEDDPLGIFSELKTSLLSFFPITTAMVLSFVDAGQLNKKYVIEWELLIVFGHIMIMYCTTLHLVLLAKWEKSSSNPKGNQIISIRGGDPNNKKQLPDASALDVIKILEEPKVRNALLEHCINELSSENLVFMIKVRTWKSIWDKESPEKVIRIAVNIYQEYVSRDSKSTINIPNKVFQTVEKEMQPYVQHSLARASDASISTSQLATSPLSSEQRKPRKDLFDECMQECSLIIKTDTLPRFIKSPLFKERVIDSDLLQKIYL